VTHISKPLARGLSGALRSLNGDGKGGSGRRARRDCPALGEISPKESAQFIGKEMRLSKVEYAPRAESGPIFTFYTGKNTPERKDYIMDKLIVPVEG
jgi:hypothetical protein